MEQKLLKPIARFGLLLIAAFALVGCGGDDGVAVTTTGAQTTETTAATTSAPTTSAPTTSAETTTSIAPTTSTPPTTDQTGQPIEVYFGVGDGTNCGEVRGFARTVDGSVDLYRSTYVELVAGPTATETEAGAASFFSTETFDAVTSAVLDDGVLRVDFTDIRTVIPNASSSCGSEALLAQLNATAFQFPEVERTRFLIDGSCGDFAGWLQRECFESDRSGAEIVLPTVE